MSVLTRAAGWGLAISLVGVPLIASPALAATPIAPAHAAWSVDEAPAHSALSVDEAAARADAQPTSPLGVTHAQNPTVPVGAAWTEEYFPSSAPSSNGDQVELHADVLRPADLAPGEKTPVIMSIGPYFSHSGMNADTHPAHTGPSTRFTDLIDGAQLMSNRYTFVYVDLRGFGASTGCTDWVGPGEQADVVSAVEWAAAQPWSTGAVGLYGKSYDGSTGLAGIDHQPEGLKAVVAQEPAWSGYDYLITNDVSRPQQVETPLSYLGIAGLPGVDRSFQQDGYDIASDTEKYRANAAYEKSHPECAETLLSETKEMSRTSAFWSSRDLPANVNGSTVPLMFTQGLTEQNTKPESMQLFLANHAGEQRGWLGPWDHVRGNEVDAEGRLEMGRAGWFDEVLAFYDAHLKQQTTEIDSRFLIQDNFGAWRLQDTWGTTAKTVTVDLRPGSYLDTGRGTQDDDPGTPDPSPNPLLLADAEDPGPGTNDAPETHDASLGILTLSHPLRTDVRLTGTPSVELHTQGPGNTAVQLWDVAPDQTAVTINASVTKLADGGVTRFTLLGMDWTLKAGHRLAVAVDTIDNGWWVPQPSGTEVVVTGGTVDIAVEPTTADVATEGARAPFLDEYISDYTWENPFPAAPETFTLSAALGRIATPTATVTAGTDLVVTGQGYDPGALVALAWSDTPAATPTADATGAFSFAIPVPSTTPPGPATLTARAEDGTLSTLEVTVLAAAAPLPPTPASTATPDARAAALAATGAPTTELPLLAAGAALTLLAGLTLTSRRRRAARG